MALISILAFVIVAAIAAFTRHRSLDPAVAGATIVKVKQLAGAAVEGFTFIDRLASVISGKRISSPRIGQTVGIRPFHDDDEE